MRHLQVESSCIKSVGYNRKCEILEIDYKGSGLYQYGNISPEQWAEFSMADSMGKWVWNNLRKNVDEHPYERVKREVA